jgi:hypothetical protein
MTDNSSHLRGGKRKREASHGASQFPLEDLIDDEQSGDPRVQMECRSRLGR